MRWTSWQVRAASAPFLVLLLSCSPARVAGFGFEAPGGTTHALVQAASFPAGSEGVFRGPAPANRFILAEAPVYPGGDALEFTFSVPAAGPLPMVRLTLSSREDGTEPSAEKSVTLAPGRFIYVFRLGAGTGIRSIAVGVEGPVSGVSNDTELFRLEALAIRPALAGMERLEGGVRISDGVSLYRAAGVEHCRIATPFRGVVAASTESLPALVLDYAPGPAGARVEISVDGKSFLGFSARPGGGRLVLPAALFSGLVASVEVAATSITACRASSIPAIDGELLDFGVVRKLPPRDPAADFDLYRWDLLPAVLLLDFRNYATQDRYLKRLAFFVEKLGFRGRLASDAEIAPLHGWNAHDYRPEDLAAFFTKAVAEGFSLGPEELALRKLLSGRGLILEKGGTWEAGKGAIISITRESNDTLRATFLVHESLHALYFVDPAFRARVDASWKGLSAEERWFWTLYFGWSAYDTANGYLMANEYMAYLLQQPLERVREYFTRNLPARMLANHKELLPKMEAWMAEWSDSFERRAEELGDLLAETYGLKPGRAWFLD